jgi:hypothetical protein
MAETRLKRKTMRNFAKANNTQASIKKMTWKPTIKNIDIEEIKASFKK